MAFQYPQDKLPLPVRDSYSETYERQPKRSQMDDGQSRWRRQWYSKPVSLTVSWVFNFAEFAYFEAMLKYDLSFGSAWFEMPLSSAMAALTLRFTEYPEASFDSSRQEWLVTGKLIYLEGAGAIPPKGAELPMWLEELPAPDQQGYSIKSTDAFAVSDISEGLAQERVRFQSRVATFTGTWLMTLDQLMIFRQFLQEQLIGGLAPFISYFSNGKGRNKVKTRFTSFPSYSAQGACFLVTAEMETTDIPTLSYAEYSGFNHLEFAETYTLAETFALMHKTNADEQFQFTEVFQLVLRKSFADSYSFTENVSFKATLQKGTQDQYQFTESGAIMSESVYVAGTFVQGVYADSIRTF